LMSVASAAATPGLYPGEAGRVRAAEGLNGSPAIVALYGPILDVRSVGELAMTKLTVLYAVFVAVLFIVLVRRHTRVEEESGRTELVAGTGVGRDAPLAASVIETDLLAAVLGLLTAAANALAGLELIGSIAFGGLWAGTALVAAGVGAVAAQLSASARTCAGYAAAVIGAFFVLRAVGDTGPVSLSWLSPLGWNTQVRAYSETRWWLLLMYPLLAAGLFAVARLLRSRRDLGAGLLAAHAGPPSGSPHLSGPLSLTLKVHVTMLGLWTGAVAVLGVLFGMITPGIGDLLESETAQELIDQLGGVLIAAILSVIAVVVTYFASTVISHAGRDEIEGRAELALSTATSRSHWFAASVAVALIGTTWVLAVTGIGLWIGYDVAGGPGVDNLVVAAMAWAPAVWVAGGLSALCLAIRPTWAAAAWAWPGVFLTLVIVGDLLELPGWVVDLSPYSHVPALPAASWDWGAELGLTGAALVLVLLAGWRYNARDVG
jgi:ABC-2 type transport system permease protein